MSDSRHSNGPAVPWDRAPQSAQDIVDRERHRRERSARARLFTASCVWAGALGVLFYGLLVPARTAQFDCPALLIEAADTAACVGAQVHNLGFVLAIVIPSTITGVVIVARRG